MVALVAGIVGVVGSGMASAESIPPNPTIYTGGTVTVGGIVPSDSVTESVGPVERCIERCIVAKIQRHILNRNLDLEGYLIMIKPSVYK